MRIHNQDLIFVVTFVLEKQSHCKVHAVAVLTLLIVPHDLPQQMPTYENADVKIRTCRTLNV